MNQKHDAKAKVRGDDKATQLDDILQIRRCDHFGHQRQHTVGRQFHHQANQLHHPGLQRIDRRQDAFTLGRIIAMQLQRCNTEQSGENYRTNN